MRIINFPVMPNAVFMALMPKHRTFSCILFSQQLIEQLKVRLDRRFGAVWQCTVVRGAYTTCNAHVPGTNMCFRYGGMSYILYKSAQFDGNTDDDDFGGSDSQ